MEQLDWLFGELIMGEEDADDVWQITAFDGEKYDISPFDYDTEIEYDDVTFLNCAGQWALS